MSKRFLKNIAFDFIVMYPVISVYFFSDRFSSYAENAISFVGVLMLILGSLMAILSDQVAKSISDDIDSDGKKTGCHKFYSGVTSIFEVLIFSMLGWYWVAAGFLVAHLGQSIINDKVK